MLRSAMPSSGLLLAAAVLFVPSVADSADGDLDPSFGAGILRFPYRTAPESRCALLRQPDGALLVAGYGEDGAGPFLARLGAGGEPDSSFGSEGVVPAGPGDSHAGVDLALQPDGKILLAVAMGDSLYEAFVVRFDSAGSPDPSFGVQGIAYSGLHPLGSGSVAIAVSQGGQGNVYLAAQDTGDGLSVVRFDSSGVLGPAFGGAGVASPGFYGGMEAGLDLALGSGILLAGFDNYAGQNCVTRFAWNGIVDSTFGGEGTGAAHTGLHTSELTDVALDVRPDGKMLLAGHDLYGTRSYVFRFDADGIPDPSFGAAGFAPAVPGSDRYAGLDVVALPDGGVALAGTEDAVPRVSYLAVFDAGGTLVPGYGTGGILSIPIRRGYAADVALEAQPDGALVVAGTDDPVEHLFVARYVAPGVRDDTFHTGGVVGADIPGHWSSARSLAIQGNGSMLLASYHWLREQVYVQRFDSTGLRDPDFGAEGYTVLAGIQAAVTAPITIVTESGTHRKYVATHDYAVGQHCILRMDTAGIPDSTWGNDAVAYTGVAAGSGGGLDLALQWDRKVLVAVDIGGATGIRVVRLDADGLIDPTFGGGTVTPGWATTLPSRVAVEASPVEGAYVAALDSYRGELGIARFSGAGLLDTSFGAGGVAHTGVGGTCAVDLKLDTGILVAGVDVGTGRPYVARFQWDGTLDPAFGDAGTGVAYAMSAAVGDTPLCLAVEPAGRIYLAGNHDSENFLVRFFPDGRLDTGFGAGGIATPGGWVETESSVALGIQDDGKVVLASCFETSMWPAGDVLARFEASPFGGTAAPARGVGEAFALDPCVPNPFRHETATRFSLPVDGLARATVHDVQGRLVTTLMDGPRAAGSHRLGWSGRDRLGRPVASGIYFLRLESGGEVRTRKVARVRD